MNISEVIDQAGGAKAIANAARKGGRGIKRVSVEAIYKWRQRGVIPHEHWPLLIKLGLTLNEIYEANLETKTRRARPRLRGEGRILSAA